MPFYGLVLTFILIYVQPGGYYPFINDAKLGTIIPILVFLISLFVKSQIDHADIWRNSVTKYLLFFIFLVIVSSIFKPAADALNELKLVVGHFFLYYSIIRISDTRKKLNGVILTLGLVHILLIYLNPDLILHPETRSYVEGVSFLGDGNDFALSLCLTFPLMLLLYLESKKKTARVLLMSILVVIVLAIIGSQSRGASLALGGVLFYLWLQSRQKVLGIVAIGILSVVVVLFAAPEYFVRMGTIQSFEEEGSAQGRIKAWNSGFRMARSNPVLGVGAGNFGVYNSDVTAHSMYFLALGELGFPGAFFIIGYLVMIMRGIRRRLKSLGEEQDDKTLSNKRKYIHMQGSVIGFAIAGTFLSVLYYPHLFVVGALYFVTQHLYEREQKQSVSAGESEDDSMFVGTKNNTRTRY